VIYLSLAKFHFLSSIHSRGQLRLWPGMYDWWKIRDPFKHSAVNSKPFKFNEKSIFHTISKAFSKSTNTAKRCPLFCYCLIMASWILTIWSTVFRPRRNPVCILERIWYFSRYQINRLLISFSINLHIAEVQYSPVRAYYIRFSSATLMTARPRWGRMQCDCTLLGSSSSHSAGKD